MPGLVVDESLDVKFRRICRGFCPRIRQEPLNVQPLCQGEPLVRTDAEEVAEDFEEVARVEARLRKAESAEDRREKSRGLSVHGHRWLATPAGESKAAKLSPSSAGRTGGRFVSSVLEATSTVVLAAFSAIMSCGGSGESRLTL